MKFLPFFFLVKIHFSKKYDHRINSLNDFIYSIQYNYDNVNVCKLLPISRLIGSYSSDRYGSSFNTFDTSKLVYLYIYKEYYIIYSHWSATYNNSDTHTDSYYNKCFTVTHINNFNYNIFSGLHFYDHI